MRNESPRLPILGLLLTSLLGSVSTVLAQQQTPIKAFTGNSSRAATRVFLYTDNSGFKPMGQMSIDYGLVNWKSEYKARVQGSELDNLRWRFGRDFWTNLNNNIPVSIGGARIAAGHRYLTIVRRPGKRYFLEFNDPAKIRPRRLDAFQASSPLMPEADFAVRLTHETLPEDKAAKQLTLNFEANKDDPTKGRLVIDFGDQRLTCPFEMHP